MAEHQGVPSLRDLDSWNVEPLSTPTLALEVMEYLCPKAHLSLTLLTTGDFGASSSTKSGCAPQGGARASIYKRWRCRAHAHLRCSAIVAPVVTAAAIVSAILYSTVCVVLLHMRLFGDTGYSPHHDDDHGFGTCP